VRDRQPTWEGEDKRGDASKSYRIRRFSHRPLVSWAQR
jgi:hypothetical protein